MRLYKRTQTSRNWEVQFRDGSNVIRRLALFSDKTASMEAGRKIEKLVALRMAGENPDIPLMKWLMVCPARILHHLAEWGIIDNSRAAASTSLDTHVKDWREAMQHKQFADRYIKCVVNIVTRCAEYSSWKTLMDMTREGLTEYLAFLSAKGRAPDTLNHQTRALKAFANWLLDENRLAVNPFTRYPMLNPETDRRKKRRALTEEELHMLLKAAEAGVFTKGLTGHERMLIYSLAVETGFRWGEIRSLTISAFSLDSENPSVTLEAKDAKNRRQTTQQS